MPDEKDFGIEETKSTILDYFILFKQVQIALLFIIVGSVTVFFLFKETFLHLLEHFRDNGLVYTIPDEPFIFVIDLDAAFIWSFAGMIITPGVIAVIAWLFYSTIIKGRKLQKHLINFQSNLIKKSYLTNFELVEPEIIIQGGDPKLEKFVNHLSLVFTEINKKNEKRLEKRKTVEQAWTYNEKWGRKRRFAAFKNYFFATGGFLGYYVVQYFEKTVTVEDIQKIIKSLNKEKIFWNITTNRFIILGKKFDSSFDDENILLTMNELKRKFKIDIILETEYGYSTMWID